MPERKIVARELADILGVIAHPARVRIIEELGQGEKDVSELVELTGLAQPTACESSSTIVEMGGLFIIRSRNLGWPRGYSMG